MQYVIHNLILTLPTEQQTYNEFKARAFLFKTPNIEERIRTR